MASKYSAKPGTSSDNQLLDLRSSRQRRGVSLEDIAERTKISIRFLRAIEAEDFDQLPGGIFATSYLRQYAAAAGVEESRLLNIYSGKLQDKQASGAEPADRPAVRGTLAKFLLGSVVAGR